MKIYHGIDEFEKVNHPVVTVGTFDGLHLGHQKIIRRMHELAEASGGETILVTFSPHPRIVLNNNKSEIRFISNQHRKFELLEHFGIHHMIVIPFTREFAQTPSDVFVKEYLVDKIGVKHLIVGYDHHFGKNREGNYHSLIEQGKTYQFEVEEVSAQYVNDVPVSSTKIRKALAEGDVKAARQMLGYSYSISGKVVQGNKIGRTLGFPTANIEIADEFKLIAAGGVYACRVKIGGELFAGMGNIGTRPTLGKHELVTEVHIFDFDQDIYNQNITIYFIDRIRDEQKFPNLKALKNQLTKDKQQVQQLFGGN